MLELAEGSGDEGGPPSVSSNQKALGDPLNPLVVGRPQCVVLAVGYQCSIQLTRDLHEPRPHSSLGPCVHVHLHFKGFFPEIPDSPPSLE